MAPHPAADGRQIFIDVYDSETPDAEILAAIERLLAGGRLRPRRSPAAGSGFSALTPAEVWTPVG